MGWFPGAHHFGALSKDEVHRDRLGQPRSVDEVLSLLASPLEEIGLGEARWVADLALVKNILRIVLCSDSLRPPAVVAFSSVLTSVNALQIS